MERIVRLFRTLADVAGYEECFCFGVSTADFFTARLMQLSPFLLEQPGMRIHLHSQLAGERVGEVGPRPAFATAFSSNRVDALNKSGFPEITRAEKFRRYRVPSGATVEACLAGKFDPMTECVYPRPIESFTLPIEPEPVRFVPLMEQGIQAWRDVNQRFGLGVSEEDMRYYHHLFTTDPSLMRNPTDVECFQLGQMGSNHCRHRDWNAEVQIWNQALEEWETMPFSLIQLVQEPYRNNPGNSVIGFYDNASSIRIGFGIWIVPENPAKPSKLIQRTVEIDGTCTVETHNHPTRISPGPGAETGIGGCYRDSHAVGRGGLILHSLAGFFAGNLHIPGYPLPWEREYPAPASGAAALQIMLEAPKGTWDYGNKYGIPVLGGATRTVDMEINGQRWGYRKPIMLAGNVGTMDHRHAQKGEAEPGMVIVGIGGLARRVGFGGGSASSQTGGAISAASDFNSVQRGDAQMGLRTRCVIEACVALGEANPIVSIHDQGAGGPCNVLTELVEKSGGKIDIRRINVGDATLSVVEIWGAECQERYGLLIRRNQLALFQEICKREECPCEVLGEVTGDGRIVVTDSRDNTTPVNLPIKRIMSGLPRRVIRDKPPASLGRRLVLPENLTIGAALERVLRLPAVGSKGYLAHRVDRSVGGLAVQSPCCGPLQLPVADAQVSALDFSGSQGIASSIGVQPLKAMLGWDAGVRMSVAEAATNLAGVAVSDIRDIKMQGNVMWPGTKDGEMVKLYYALNGGVREFSPQHGIVEDGGKDSMSMIVDDESGAMVKSPNTFVATLYAPVPDVRLVLTPDLKRDRHSTLLLLDLGCGRNRLGGSALGQVYEQLGDECPDIDGALLSRGFNAAQQLIKRGLALSYHDRSDGGLITTLVEMGMAGNCGLKIRVPAAGSPHPFLFAEEAGMVIECANERLGETRSRLKAADIPFIPVAQTDPGRNITISSSVGKELWRESLDTVRSIWEATSFEMEKLQINPDCARAEHASQLFDRAIPYRLNFAPKKPASTGHQPKVAVVRTTGTNGHHEMAALFRLAGFEVWPVHMTDLEERRITSFNQFRGLLFPGGFANADVFGAGRAWAMQVQSNPELKCIFAEFLSRPDTFSFGPCNGFQFMTGLGWVPFATMEPNPAVQPVLIRNKSRAFESRWSMGRVLPSPAIMFRGMEGAQLGIHAAHGEGQLWFPSQAVQEEIAAQSLVPLANVGPDDELTEDYPFNPNGSPHGWTSLCDLSGRHVGMMPHPERLVRLESWTYLPPDIKKRLTTSPWMQVAYNLHQWCCETR